VNSRLSLNLALLAIAIVLGLIAWLRPGIEPEPAPQKLTELDQNSVSTMEIVRVEDRIGFHRQGEQWFVAGDPELPADPLQISSLLRLANAEIRRRYPANEMDLASLELDPAPITVKFDSTELAIGGTDPLENLRYVRTGDTVALVQDTFHTMLKGKRTNFASRRLLPEGATIESISLPEATVSRDAEGQWVLDPERKNVTADTIQALVDGWVGAQALWVAESGEVPDDSKTIAVTLAGEDSPIIWHLVEADNSTSLVRPDLGLKYAIGGGLDDQLLKLEETRPEEGVSPPIAE
jgi:hypothetical protein